MNQKSSQQNWPSFSAMLHSGVATSAAALRVLSSHWIGRVILALFVASALFWLFPGLDIAASSIFGDKSNGFPASAEAFPVFLRFAGNLATVVLLVFAFCALIVGLLFRKPWLVLIEPAEALFIMLTYVVGPGLLVNVVLKDHIGRARPREILEFGGQSLFTPVWQHTHECLSNCSFTSGEAASAMGLLSILFCIPESWRRWVGAFLVPFTIAASIDRIAFGGHFLSDVLLSWLIVLLVMLLLRHVLLTPKARFHINSAAFGAWGSLPKRIAGSYRDCAMRMRSAKSEKTPAKR